MKVKTIIYSRIGLGGFSTSKEKTASKFDEKVNEALREISGKVIDIKYSFISSSGYGIATAMIIYEEG